MVYQLFKKECGNRIIIWMALTDELMKQFDPTIFVDHFREITKLK